MSVGKFLEKVFFCRRILSKNASIDAEKFVQRKFKDKIEILSTSNDGVIFTVGYLLPSVEKLQLSPPTFFNPRHL